MDSGTQCAVMTRERNDTGQYVETVGLEDVIDVFDSVEGPAITSSDVADALNCTTEAARQKLTRLYDRGVIDKRKSGRTVIYWQPQEGHETPVTPPEPIDGLPPAEDDRREREANEAEQMAAVGDGADADEPPTLVEELRSHLEENDLPPKTPHGRNVVVDIFELLRERGTMKTAEIQEAVYPDYTDHWSTPRTMWNATDRYLEEIPGIEKAGYGEWTYAGDDVARTTL